MFISYPGRGTYYWIGISSLISRGKDTQYRQKDRPFPPSLQPTPLAFNFLVPRQNPNFSNKNPRRQDRAAPKPEIQINAANLRHDGDAAEAVL